VKKAFSIVSVIFACATVWAAGPPVVTYQGSLLTPSGQPIPTGLYNMTFVLFDAPNGGIAHYNTQKNAVPVSLGFFSVELDNLNNVFQNNDNLWMEISIDLDSPPNGIQSDEIYFPRQRVTSVAYAQAAMEADNALTLGGLAPGQFLQNNQQFISTVGPNGLLNTLLGQNGGNTNHGWIGVFNSTGTHRGEFTVDPDDRGALRVFGPTGTLAATLFSTGNPALGRLDLFGPSGAARASAFVESDNVGAIRTLGMNESLNVFIGATVTGANRGSVEVYDGGGNLQADLFVESNAAGATRSFGANGNLNTYIGSREDNADLGTVEVFDTTGNLRGEFFVDSLGRGILQLFGPNGEENVVLSSLQGSNNLGAIAVMNSTGNDRASMVVSTDGSGSMAVRGTDGNVYVGLFSDGNAGELQLRNGFLSVRNPSNVERALIQVTTDNSGGITLTGNNGSTNVIASSVTGGASRGAIAVFDGNNAQQAAMFVDGNNNGVVQADIKNFVAEHPSRPGTKIVYTALEGPEAAMYCRGTVRLVAGRATIVLPEHFVVLANPKTVTVQLTPGSLASRGVAVGEIAADRIEIGELMNGDGEYDVHYLVHAVRSGYEDHPVMISDAEFAATRTAAVPVADAARAADLRVIEPVTGIESSQRSSERPKREAR
jgi:hypothetical protein